MNHLRALPRAHEEQARPRAVTVVSPDTRQVVYLDEAASLEIITEALKAWGLRVRSERSDSGSRAETPTQPAPADSNWSTTRSESKAPTRLDNVLSPLWLPIREADRATEPPAAWSWFSRAA
jgi:hypothetical protein